MNPSRKEAVIVRLCISNRAATEKTDRSKNADINAYKGLDHLTLTQIKPVGNEKYRKTQLTTI